MKTTIYDDFQQNTPVWDYARLGIPTASEFIVVMRGGDTKRASITRADYLNQVVDELITGLPAETYRNQYMERGHALEQEALDAYCETVGLDVDSSPLFRKVAFVRNDKLICGCSPDALIGDGGGVEVKTLIGKQMVALRRHPDIPTKHLAQLYGNILVTGRQWWDICIYARGHRPFVRRVTNADTAYLTQLRLGIAQFNVECDAICMELEDTTASTFRQRRIKTFEEMREELYEEENPEAPDEEEEEQKV